MKRFLTLGLLFLGFAFGSCQRPQTEGPAAEPSRQTFIVQGILRGIDFAGRSVSVEHEEIPDYMPAMTMPFDVKTMTDVEPLKIGDAIEFTMFVTADAAWIEGVKKIAQSEIQLPPRAPEEPGALSNVQRLKEGDRLPAFRLVDSDGRPITHETFSGKPLVLTFIFTRCPIPNFCPLLSQNFQQIQQRLATGSGAARGRLLSISFDTEFDTPEVLAQYAASHTEDRDGWRFACGTADETQRLTALFSVNVQPGSGTIAHGLATALVDADGVIRKIWRGNGWRPDDVIKAMQAL